MLLFPPYNVTFFENVHKEFNILFELVVIASNSTSKKNDWLTVKKSF